MASFYRTPPPPPKPFTPSGQNYTGNPNTQSVVYGKNTAGGSGGVSSGPKQNFTPGKGSTTYTPQNFTPGSASANYTPQPAIVHNYNYNTPAPQQNLNPINNQTSNQAPASNLPNRDILGTPKTYDEQGNLVQQSGQEQFQNILGIGLAGAGATRVASLATTTAGISEVPGGITGLLEDITRTRISKASNVFGKSYNEIAKKVDAKMLANEIDSIAKTGNPAAILGKIAKLSTFVGAAAFSLDFITNWMSIDNVLGQSSMYANNLAKDAQYGNVDPSYAISQIQNLRDVRQAAIDKIDASTKINPLMWSYRRLFMGTADLTTQQFDNSILKVQSIIDNKQGQINSSQGNPFNAQQMTTGSTGGTDFNEAQYVQDRQMLEEQYMADQQKLQDQWTQAQNDKRFQDAAQFEQQMAARQKQYLQNQQANQQYWNEFQRKKAKSIADNAPSKLKFGLL